MSAPVAQTPKVTCPECGGRKGYQARRCLDCAIRSYRAPSEARDPVAVFWAKVDMSAGLFGCWPWIGSRDPDGYGLFRAPKATHRPTRRAHREAFELTFGPVPDGLHVLHTCDNPPCVNPLHLYAGTEAENARDKVMRGRAAVGLLNGAYTKPERRRRGSENGNSIFTEGQVAVIKARLRAGERRAVLAAEYGASRGAIRNIAIAATWTHVQPAKEEAAA